MDDIAVQLWVWLVILAVGFFIGNLVSHSTWSNESGEMIESCRREHNIYECQIQAVPVAQPGWVSNGESK